MNGKYCNGRTTTTSRDGVVESVVDAVSGAPIEGVKTAMEVLRLPRTREEYARLHRAWLEDTEHLRAMAARFASLAAPKMVIQAGSLATAMEYPADVQLMLDYYAAQVRQHAVNLGLVEPHP